MPRLVVKPLVSAQRLERHHAARAKQAVGAHNDQRHRHKEQQNDHGDVGGRSGKVIPRPQRDQPEQRQQPAAFGFPLAHPVRVEQVDGVGPPHLPQVEQVQAEKQHRHGRRRLPGAGNAEGKAQHRVKLHQPQQHQQHQFGEQRPQRQTRRHAGCAEEQHLEPQHRGDVAFLHAQDVVQRQLPVAPTDDKAVGIGHDPDGQKRHDNAAQPQHQQHVGRAAHLHNAVVVGQKQHQVAHGGAGGADQEKREIILPVLGQVLPGQPQVQRQFSHGPHPRKARSACPKCGRTSARWSAGRGTAGGRPGRPAKTAPGLHGWRPARCG